MTSQAVDIPGVQADITGGQANSAPLHAERAAAAEAAAQQLLAEEEREAAKAAAEKSKKQKKKVKKQLQQAMSCNLMDWKQQSQEETVCQQRQRQVASHTPHLMLPVRH